MMKFKINYTMIIVLLSIANSNYIGTSLIRLIQEVKSKGKKTIRFIQRNFILINILERIIG